MVAHNDEQPIKMFAVYSGQAGFYLAMVPAALTPERMEDALHELGVDGEAIPEKPVGGRLWMTWRSLVFRFRGRIEGVVSA